MKVGPWLQYLIGTVLFIMAACNNDTSIKTDNTPDNKFPLEISENIDDPNDSGDHQHTDHNNNPEPKTDIPSSSRDNKETKPSSKIKHRVKKDTRFPLIKFLRERYDFGNIIEGDSLRFTFDFINEGTAPLEIMDVEMSCGCTSLSYPKEPIDSGKSGKIEVLYNSLGKIGRQAPTITIISNSRKNSYSILQLDGVVYPKEKEIKKDSLSN